MSEINSVRVRRGGSWYYNGPQYAQVANRISGGPGNRGDYLGIRLVEEVEEVEEDQTPASWKRRVYRGGSWYNAPQGARTALRRNDAPGRRSGSLGVRLVEGVDEDLAPASGSKRVNRGGGWGSVPQGARVAFRSGYDPGRRNDRLGIRLVEVLGDEQTNQA